ncbi:MAG: hypothetical protein SPK32_07685, partial [Bacteroidaceae bacterium]|nr:hypothetical protein [Bacteroidaceae bacterium]
RTGMKQQSVTSCTTSCIDYNEAQMKALCKKWRAGEITATAAMKELGLKPNTFYRRVKEMGL